jgi:hypothetical protein
MEPCCRPALWASIRQEAQLRLSIKTILKRTKNVIFLSVQINLKFSAIKIPVTAKWDGNHAVENFAWNTAILAVAARAIQKMIVKLVTEKAPFNLFFSGVAWF